jgi:hypothetical protein
MHLSRPTNSSLTMGGELAKIRYLGDGPNCIDEFPISAHLEIHVEQHTDLEKAGLRNGNLSQRLIHRLNECLTFIVTLQV